MAGALGNTLLHLISKAGRAHVYSYGLCSYGLHRYSLYGYGVYSYGLARAYVIQFTGTQCSMELSFRARHNTVVPRSSNSIIVAA